jgi:hypothetical protein
MEAALWICKSIKTYMSRDHHSVCEYRCNFFSFPKAIIIICSKIAALEVTNASISFHKGTRVPLLLPISPVADSIIEEQTAPKFPSFTFLHGPSALPDENNAESNHPIPIFARKRGVPWLTEHPTCRRSKHWSTIERLARQFLDTVCVDASRSSANLPTKFQDLDAVHSRKENEIIETALKSTAHMMPDASPVQAGMIAQTMVIIVPRDGENHHIIVCR